MVADHLVHRHTIPSPSIAWGKLLVCIENPSRIPNCIMPVPGAHLIYALRHPL